MKLLIRHDGSNRNVVRTVSIPRNEHSDSAVFSVVFLLVSRMEEERTDQYPLSECEDAIVIVPWTVSSYTGPSDSVRAFAMIILFSSMYSKF